MITQEYTSTIEQMILLRIKDGRFDDPVPRNANADLLAADPGESNADPLELSQEKSKVGLAEVKCYQIPPVLWFLL